MAENEDGDQYQVAEKWDGDDQLQMVQPLASNSMGFWDGARFYLRSFAVWYRWFQVTSVQYNRDKPESGIEKGVHFEQSMGRMSLWYELDGVNADLTEEDFCVAMSCWDMTVVVGRDINPTKRQIETGKLGGRKIDALTGDFYDDVRRSQCWWEISGQDDGSRWLVIYLAKVKHRGWKSPWSKDPLNIHRKSHFGWSDMNRGPKDKPEDETMSKCEPGPPQNLDKDLCVAIVPEKLCTGIEAVNEDDYTAEVLVHLDEESLEVATCTVAMEDLFSADVESDTLSVFIRNDGFGICWGKLKGYVIPELTTWEISSTRRYNMPAGSNIRCPAFYNPALRIILYKAQGYQNKWGGVFEEMQSPNFQPPRERMPWTERVQRALVLSPGAPMKDGVKAERARQLCEKVECTQDTVLQRANITLHLQEGIEVTAMKFKLDLGTFFSMKVSERMLEVAVIADSEFTMCIGALGGAVEPNKTSWEIAWERDGPNSEKGHLCLKISLSKAAGSKGKWDDVFRRLEPWEVTANIHKAQALEAGVPDEDPALTKGADQE